MLAVVFSAFSRKKFNCFFTTYCTAKKKVLLSGHEKVSNVSCCNRNFFQPYTYWAKAETYAYNTGTYVAKAGADPEHGRTLWGYFATAYLYVQ